MANSADIQCIHINTHTHIYIQHIQGVETHKWAMNRKIFCVNVLYATYKAIVMVKANGNISTQKPKLRALNIKQKTHRMRE